MSDATPAKESAEPPGRRVLFVAGRLEPDAACRAVLALGRQLVRLGHRVEMVCRSGSIATVYPHTAENRTDAHSPPILLSRALSNNLRGRLGLRDLVSRVREVDPEIVHVHGAARAGVGARLARRLRKPYVLSIGDFLDPGQSVGLSRRFIGKILVASDAVRVDLVNRIRLPRGAIEVIPDGVDVAEGLVRPPGLKGAGVPVIGTVGRLVESKGQDVFLRAAHLLATRGRGALFVVAGEGPDRKRLQNLVFQLGLGERVTFARAPVDQLDVLRAVDVLVVPALNESLGLPVIEAMASGVPVVATSAGGIFTLIENQKTGILVPKNNPDALARAVEGVLDDPEKAAALGRAGREVVSERFNIETTARRVAAVYEAVLAGAEPAGAAASDTRRPSSSPLHPPPA